MVETINFTSDFVLDLRTSGWLIARETELAFSPTDAAGGNQSINASYQ